MLLCSNKDGQLFNGSTTFCFQANIAQGGNLGPQRITNTMAFMFESALIPRICPWALDSPFMDHISIFTFFHAPCTIYSFCLTLNDTFLF